MSTNPSANSTPLDEWDFSSVRDDEVRDCCLYEYAREAEQTLWRTLRRAVAAERWAFRRGEPPGRIVGLGPLFQWLDMQGRRDDYERPFVPPLPWQKLTSEQRPVVWQALAILRRRLGGAVAGSKSPVPALMPIPVAALASGWAQPEDTHFHDVRAVGAGRLWFAREINLAAYTDEQILAEFRVCIDGLRARSGIPEPSVDRLTTWRGRLDALGLLRLRHTTPRHLLQALLLKHSSIGHLAKLDGDAFQKQLDDRLRVARQTFRTLFPELGKDAQPASADPHG